MGKQQRVRKIRTKPKPVRFHVRDADGTLFASAYTADRLYVGTGFNRGAAAELWKRVGRELGYTIDGTARQTVSINNRERGWETGDMFTRVGVGQRVRVKQGFGVVTDLVVSHYSDGRTYVLDGDGTVWDASRKSHDHMYRVVGNGYCLRLNGDDGASAYILPSGDFKVGCTVVRRAKMLRLWKRLAQWMGYELV